MIKESGLFDPVYYLLTYPDVRIADMDPLTHFAKIGWKEGLNPSEKFDTKFYLESNPDVKESGYNPVIHYILIGTKEGRRALPTERFVSPRSSKSHLPEHTPIKLLSMGYLRRGMSYIKIYGFKNFVKKAWAKLFPDGALRRLEKPTTVNIIGNRSVTLSNPAAVTDVIDRKISIIIPTKNAGDDFSFLLKVLQLQEGFREIEIIIVDSGSSDNTVQIAESRNAMVIQIDPSEFSHSFSRNLGAERATGDYLLFTVQDALPPSLTWLYELFQVLNDQDVVAVSCAETPRENSDLFYRQICWNHYNFLEINEGDRIFSLPDKTDNISLRQNAQLSDLANLISREVFTKYQYRLNYAEDLDLGIRLIKDGFKIAFLGSVRIIHSHKRSPYYYLKRGYVDNQFLSDVFDDFVVPKINLAGLVPDVAFSYAFLNHLIIQMNSFPQPLTPEMFENKTREIFAQGHTYKYPGNLPIEAEHYLDRDAQSFLEGLIIQSRFQVSGRKYDGFLLEAFLGYVTITFNYLKNTYEIIGESLLLEIKECFYKAFCIVVGAGLAYCNRNRTGDELQDMDKMQATLMDGV